MTSGRNRSASSNKGDFTESAYSELLLVGRKAGRNFVSYDSIPWGSDYTLWRHDIDFSINRAHRLATLNLEQSVHATFFINIHSTFYNAFEPGQMNLLREICSMGHDIGVHFDAEYYGDAPKDALDLWISREATYLSELCEKAPVAVSFHNPTSAMLSVDNLVLGGLINAYSQRIMSDSVYCSDSNGYWRDREGKDVLSDPTVRSLQLLTHPGWWCEDSLAPRARIEQAVYGRAERVIGTYDRQLEEFGRPNIM